MQSEDVTRERQLNIRLSEDELRRLESLAKHYGLNIASVIRMLVKRDVDALGLASEHPQVKTTTKKTTPKK